MFNNIYLRLRTAASVFERFPYLVNLFPLWVSDIFENGLTHKHFPETGRATVCSKFTRKLI